MTTQRYQLPEDSPSFKTSRRFRCIFQAPTYPTRSQKLIQITSVSHL